MLVTYCKPRIYVRSNDRVALIARKREKKHKWYHNIDKSTCQMITNIKYGNKTIFYLIIKFIHLKIMKKKKFNLRK